MSQNQAQPDLWSEVSVIRNEHTGALEVVPGKTKESFERIHTPSENNDLSSITRMDYTRLDVLDLDVSITESKLMDWVESHSEEIREEYQ